MLDHGQRIAALILFAIALTAWLVVAIRWQPGAIPPSDPYWAEADSLRHLSDSLRRDSLRRVREARWEQKKDSFRRVDNARFARWAQERQLRYDSARLADSLWRDSVGWHYASSQRKIDTILDLNHTDTSQLRLIRGIGAYKARRIMRYGQLLGGYCSPAQLLDAEMADLQLDTLLRFFTADPRDVQRIAVNRCRPEQMTRHPYLRFTQAKALYEYRRAHVHIDSIAELRNVRELTEEDINRLAPYLSFAP